MKRMGRNIGYLTLVMTALVLVSSGLQGWAVEPKNGEWEVIVCNPLLNQLEMESTWAAAKVIGVKGIEVNVDFNLICSSLFVGKNTPFSMETTEDAKKLAAEASAQGLITPVICAPLRLNAAEGETTAPEWAKTLITHSPLIGAKVIYFPIGVSKPAEGKVDDQIIIQKAIALLKGLVEQGKKSGVAIAIENLQMYWNRPELTRPVLEAFKPEEFNLCLDPINLYWYGFPRSKVYEIAQSYLPRTRHFHVKNVAHPADQQEKTRTPGWKYSENSVPAAEGDLDFKTIIPQLYKAGYKGCISIEDDSLGHYPKEQRVKILQQDVQYLRDIIQHL